jgi:hypothetical protein
MERLLYIGPELAVMFSKRHATVENGYYAVIRSHGTKLTAIISFACVKAEKGPTECTMNIEISGLTGTLATVEVLSKVINCLQVNRKMAGEVCCQAFLNGFLDSDF